MSAYLRTLADFVADLRGILNCRRKPAHRTLNPRANATCRGCNPEPKQSVNLGAQQGGSGRLRRPCVPAALAVPGQHQPHHVGAEPHHAGERVHDAAKGWVGDPKS